MSDLLHGQGVSLREAAEAMVRAADDYPAEVSDTDDSWRLGGAAREAWATAIRNLRAALSWRSSAELIPN
jgi:hypothetical protein